MSGVGTIYFFTAFSIFAAEQFVPMYDVSSKPISLHEIMAENNKYTPFIDVCVARIVGGNVIPIEMAPYQIALKQRSDRIWFTFCGGSLVTFKYILTAAHCFTGSYGQLLVELDKVSAVAGSDRTDSTFEEFHAEDHRRIKNFWKHKGFNPQRFKDDIGLVEVVKQFYPAASVRPIRLHTNLWPVELRQGQSCGISGYGTKEHDKQSQELRLVCLPIVSKSECTKHFGNVYITDKTICAGSEGKDSCTGDSGGPLVCGGVQVGILSFGGVCGKFPGVYTRLDQYVLAPKGTSNDCSTLSKCCVYISFISTFIIKLLI